MADDDSELDYVDAKKMQSLWFGNRRKQNMVDITPYVEPGDILSTNYTLVDKIADEAKRDSCGRYLLFFGMTYYPDNGVKDLLSHSDDRDAWEFILASNRLPEENNSYKWYQIVDRETMSILEEGEVENDLEDILKAIDKQTSSLRRINHV